MSALRAPFPWFGGKRRVAPEVWERFGAELRRLAEAATPTPWEWGGSEFRPELRRVNRELSGSVLGCGALFGPTEQDAALITVAVNALPALLDAAEERDEIADRLAQLLCDLTGGRLSKTAYPVPVMVQEIEQYLSECHESDLKDERDALAAQVERVRALVSDWQANANSRELGDPTASVWHEAALQLLRALDGGE